MFKNVTIDARYILRINCLIFVMILGKTYSLKAQNSSFEFWPEADLWYILNPSWRLTAFIPLTDYQSSKPSDLNVYLQADYAFGHTKRFYSARLLNENRAREMKAWLARVGVMRGGSLSEDGDYHEDVLYGEIHRRLPVGDKILHSHRLRPELRWLGEDNKFSYRIRYRLMFEKEFTRGHWSMVPYANVEPYWDSRYSTISRVRLIGGTTISWGPRFALEGNLTYQYDEHYDTSNLYAFNMILHVFFEGKHAKPPPLEGLEL